MLSLLWSDRTATSSDKKTLLALMNSASYLSLAFQVYTNYGQFIIKRASNLHMINFGEAILTSLKALKKPLEVVFLYRVLGFTQIREEDSDNGRDLAYLLFELLV